MAKLTKRELVLGGAALAAAPGLAAGQVYRTPGVYIEEIPSGLRAIQPLATAETVLVTSFLAESKPARVRFMGELKGLVRPEGRPLVEGWAEAFFSHGGRSLYLFPAKDSSPDGLIGSAETLTGFEGLRRAGALWSPHWPGGEKPIHTGIIIAPEVALLPDTADAASVYRIATSVAESLAALMLIDTPEVLNGVPFSTWTQARDWRAQLGINNGHAALYGNRAVSTSGASRPITPSIAGVIARTDVRRGVWKAPAGTEASLNHPITPLFASAEEGVLNTEGVNICKDLPSLGPVVWGARTLSGNNEDRFIPVRRLRDHITQSLRWGLQVLVAEPNEEPTWRAARAAAEGFLSGLFRNGAFPAASPNEAFFVRCGLGETMSQADIDQGRMIINVGFAPLKPAEFIVDRITFEGFAVTP
ncbi:MAG: hypothetical protein AAF830_14680 [Pseudomonadota bacterium]